MPLLLQTDRDSGKAFKSLAKQRIEEVIDPNSYNSSSSHFQRQISETGEVYLTPPTTPVMWPNELGQDPSTSVIDTWICPMVQMGVFKVTVDDLVTESLFRRAAKDSQINLASGYFNLTDHYMGTIINQSKANYDILSAAPEVRTVYVVNENTLLNYVINCIFQYLGLYQIYLSCFITGQWFLWRSGCLWSRPRCLYIYSTSVSSSSKTC